MARRGTKQIGKPDNLGPFLFQLRGVLSLDLLVRAKRLALAPFRGVAGRVQLTQPSDTPTKPPVASAPAPPTSNSIQGRRLEFHVPIRDIGQESNLHTSSGEELGLECDDVDALVARW
jgi:hypothetical protein